jgi:hypothetical protein
VFSVPIGPFWLAIGQNVTNSHRVMSKLRPGVLEGRQ